MARAKYSSSAWTHSGLSVHIVPNAEITLYVAGTGTATPGTGTPYGGTIYAGPTGGATLTNPFFADSDGNFAFYLDAGTDLRIELTGVGVGTLVMDYERVMPAMADLLFNGMTTLAAFAGGVSAVESDKTDWALTAKSTVVGYVSNIVLTNGGGGYSSPPAVSITGGGGSGATASALLTGAAVSSVVITDQGSGYTSTPTIGFSGGGGSGAAAVAYVSGGKSFRVQKPDGTSSVELERHSDPLFHVAVMDVFSLRNGTKFNMDSSGGVVFDNRMFGVVQADATTDRVMAIFQYTNSSPAGVGTPDVEPMGIIGVQAAGTDSYLRAVEIDTVSHAAVSNWPKIGAEISVQCADAGNLLDYTVGLSIRNLGNAWGVSGAQRLDAYIAIGSDTHGAENGILYRDIDSLSTGNGPLLWKATKTGAVVHAGTQNPRDDGTANLGTSSLRYGFLFAYNTLLEAGLASAPAYGFRTASTTGLYLDGTPGIGFTVGGTSRALLTASGLSVNGVAVRSGGQEPFASNLSGNTASTSYATITNGSISITPTGTVVKVNVNLCAANTTAGNATYLAVSRGGAAEVGEVVYTATVNNGQFVQSAMWTFTGVTAGVSTTVAARWKVSGGTTTIYSAQMEVVEPAH